MGSSIRKFQTQMIGLFLLSGFVNAAQLQMLTNTQHKTDQVTVHDTYSDEKYSIRSGIAKLFQDEANLRQKQREKNQMEKSEDLKKVQYLQEIMKKHQGEEEVQLDYTSYWLGFGGTQFSANKHTGELYWVGGDLMLLPKDRKAPYNLSIMHRLCKQEIMEEGQMPHHYSSKLEEDQYEKYNFRETLLEYYGVDIHDPEFHTVGFVTAGADNVKACAALFTQGITIPGFYSDIEQRGVYLTFDAVSVKGALEKFKNKEQVLEMLVILGLSESEEDNKAMNLKHFLKQQKAQTEWTKDDSNSEEDKPQKRQTRQRITHTMQDKH